jgi:hypothetical protein
MFWTSLFDIVNLQRPPIAEYRQADARPFL